MVKRWPALISSLYAIIMTHNKPIEFLVAGWEAAERKVAGLQTLVNTLEHEKRQQSLGKGFTEMYLLQLLVI